MPQAPRQVNVTLHRELCFDAVQWEPCAVSAYLVTILYKFPYTLKDFFFNLNSVDLHVIIEEQTKTLVSVRYTLKY